VCPPTQLEIADRAYQIYLGRGCQAGHDLDDWLQAEYELRGLPVRRLAELAPRKSSLALEARRRSLLDVVRTALL
jgi:hypothetical protein